MLKTEDLTAQLGQLYYAVARASEAAYAEDTLYQVGWDRVNRQWTWCSSEDAGRLHNMLFATRVDGHGMLDYDYDGEQAYLEDCIDEIGMINQQGEML